MITCTRTPAVTITLTMSKREAEVLCALLARVAGDVDDIIYNLYCSLDQTVPTWTRQKKSTNDLELGEP